MKTIYVIGPSHIHRKFLMQIRAQIRSKELFENCKLEGYKGLPVWSRHIYETIKKQTELGNDVIWMVSDYKFNNYDYPILKETHAPMFLDTLGRGCNVSKDYMLPEHITVLGNHSLKVIDYIISEFPNVKLLFWCLYKRSRANNSSYPRHLWYDEIVKRYSHNVIDIDNFTTPEEFDKCTRDKGGHPTVDGYKLLDKMIKSI